MDKDPKYFGSKYVEFCETWDDSRRLNYQPGPMVIIASSGMCEAGRIRHHLKHAVAEPDNAIVIVSYQAEKTLGRKIAEGIERISDHGPVVRAQRRRLRPRRLLRPRRPQRPRRGGTARPAARSARRSWSTVSPTASTLLKPLLQPHVETDGDHPRAASSRTRSDRHGLHPLPESRMIPRSLVFDTSRFRVDHAIFLLRLDCASSRTLIKSTSLKNSGDWNLQAMKLRRGELVDLRIVPGMARHVGR